MSEALPDHLDPLRQMSEAGYDDYVEDAREMLPEDWAVRYGKTPKVMAGGLTYALLRGEKTQEEIADEYGISTAGLRSAWRALAEDFGLEQRNPHSADNLPEQTQETDRDHDWMPCDHALLVARSREMVSGPLVRVYFEAYGNPDDAPGEHDDGHDATRFHITGRAVNCTQLTRDADPTILIDGDDGERYVVTASWNVLEAVEGGDERIEVGSDEQYLARQADDRLDPVGVSPVFAIPEDAFYLSREENDE